jgi:hypothetical protein
LAGRSGLGRDGAADSEDEDSDGGADEEGVTLSDAAQQEPGGDARGVEVTDDDSEEVDADAIAFASSSKVSDAAEEVAAARVDQSIGRALCSAKSQYWRQAQLLHPQGKAV